MHIPNGDKGFIRRAEVGLRTSIVSEITETSKRSIGSKYGCDD
jgi:hypothetical protein